MPPLFLAFTSSPYDSDGERECVRCTFSLVVGICVGDFPPTWLDGDCLCFQQSACLRCSWIPVAAVAGMVVAKETGEIDHQRMLTSVTRILTNAFVSHANRIHSWITGQLCP